MPHADLEASGYEMKIIQTSDFDRPLDDFFMVFRHVRNFQIPSLNRAKTCRGILCTTIKHQPRGLNLIICWIMLTYDYPYTKIENLDI